MGEETRYADKVEVIQAFMKWRKDKAAIDETLERFVIYLEDKLADCNNWQRKIFIIRALLFFSLSKLGCMTSYWSTHWKVWSSRYYLTFCCLNLCDQPAAWFLSCMYNSISTCFFLAWVSFFTKYTLIIVNNYDSQCIPNWITNLNLY